MAIVSKEALEEELEFFDSQIMKSYGRTPLTVSEHVETTAVFATSLTKKTEPEYMKEADRCLATKMETMKKNIPVVVLSDKDLAEFSEWEAEVKSIKGWE